MVPFSSPLSSFISLSHDRPVRPFSRPGLSQRIRDRVRISHSSAPPHSRHLPGFPLVPDAPAGHSFLPSGSGLFSPADRREAGFCRFLRNRPPSARPIRKAAAMPVTGKVKASAKALDAASVHVRLYPHLPAWEPMRVRLWTGLPAPADGHSSPHPYMRSARPYPRLAAYPHRCTFVPMCIHPFAHAFVRSRMEPDTGTTGQMSGLPPLCTDIPLPVRTFPSPNAHSAGDRATRLTARIVPPMPAQRAMRLHACTQLSALFRSRPHVSVRTPVLASVPEPLHTSFVRRLGARPAMSAYVRPRSLAAEP